MGDDAGNGTQHLELPDDFTLEDLIEVIRKGGRGNHWPIPYTGGNAHWVVKSNRGSLAHIYTDSEGEWHVEYPGLNGKTPLQPLGIKWTFGDRS